MKTLKLDLKMTDGSCDSFIAHPDDGKAHPAVLFLMDAIGPRDYLFEMATTLAGHGYFVLLPNLFYRDRRAPYTNTKFPVAASEMQEMFSHIMPLLQKFDFAKAMTDIGFFLDFLGQQKEVRTGAMGVTGYCLGGSLALKTAALYPDKIGAAASFHSGRLVTDAADSPHLMMKKVKAELYVGHADNDAHMPPEQIERFDQALRESGVRFESEVYKGAAHGFTMKDLPAYNEAALQRHWDKLLPLFQRNLA